MPTELGAGGGWGLQREKEEGGGFVRDEMMTAMCKMPVNQSNDQREPCRGV